MNVLNRYLFPPENSCIPKEDSCKLALRVFSNHAEYSCFSLLRLSKVDPIEVIQLLPEDTPLGDVVF